jgi:hypothetical protein
MFIASAPGIYNDLNDTALVILLIVGAEKSAISKNKNMFSQLLQPFSNLKNLN